MIVVPAATVALGPPRADVAVFDGFRVDGGELLGFGEAREAFHLIGLYARQLFLFARILAMV